MKQHVRPKSQSGAKTSFETLCNDGYLILRSILDPQLLEQVYDELDPSFAASAFCHGSFYGAATKRFGRVLMRSRAAERLATHPDILALIEAALGVEQRYQLNLSQAIEIHPGAPVQPPHRDHDMWDCPKDPGRTYMINVMWALDAFTLENGATRIWPGSNHGPTTASFPNEANAVDAVAPAGSAIIFLGQTMHSGGANRSSAPRRGLIFSYCLDWLLPDENPWLAYPPEIARHFSRPMSRLVGYRQRFAGLNNFEGQDPSILLAEKVEAFPVFTDAMSSGQDALIRDYYASLSGPRLS